MNLVLPGPPLSKGLRGRSRIVLVCFGFLIALDFPFVSFCFSTGGGTHNMDATCPVPAPEARKARAGPSRGTPCRRASLGLDIAGVGGQLAFSRGGCNRWSGCGDVAKTANVVKRKSSKSGRSSKKQLKWSTAARSSQKLPTVAKSSQKQPRGSWLSAFVVLARARTAPGAPEGDHRQPPGQPRNARLRRHGAAGAQGMPQAPSGLGTWKAIGPCVLK